MQYGLRQLEQTPPPLDDPEIYQRLLAIHKAIAANQFSLGAGWASYKDTSKTSGAPQVITPAGGYAALINNAGITIDTYKPADTAAFYDVATGKMTPTRLGDYRILTVRFSATCTHPDTLMEFGLDIGGSIGIISKDFRIFPKGAGVQHDVTFVSPVYALDTYLANGSIAKLMVLNGDVNIWNVEYQIARVFSTGALK